MTFSLKDIFFIGVIVNTVIFTVFRPFLLKVHFKCVKRTRKKSASEEALHFEADKTPTKRKVLFVCGFFKDRFGHALYADKSHGCEEGDLRALESVGAVPTFA